jgi:hypothetical protein
MRVILMYYVTDSFLLWAQRQEPAVFLKNLTVAVVRHRSSCCLIIQASPTLLSTGSARGT